MTDVQSHSEANGLPAQFDAAIEKAAIDHSSANAAATMSNADVIPHSDVKQPAPLESSTLREPVALSKEPSIIPESSPMDSGVVLDTDGTSGIQDTVAETQVNGHKALQLPDATSQSQLLGAPQSSLDDSVVPSSMPSEISPLTTNPGAPQSTAIAAEAIVSMPEQAPTSDLRTAPHSDHLAPEAVAAVEERKHAEDNEADSRLDPDEAAPAPTPVQVESTPINKTGLPSPPAQSPPAAPEMSHATLPASDGAAPAFEAVPAPVPVPVPAEKPAEPAPTPAVPAKEPEDIVMEEAPNSVESVTGDSTDQSGLTGKTSAPKLTREREEEDADTEEPLAKRIKTDELSPTDATAFKVPETPLAPTGNDANGSDGIPADGDSAVTAPRLAHMKKVVSNLKKSNASAAFRLPVDYVALNIPTYPEIVKQPMDLGTIDSKLKKNEYASINEFTTDFELVVHNCLIFNGREHGLTQQALKMQSSFNNQMQQLPKASEIEPSKAEKKAMKLKTEPMRAAPPRRQSVTTPASAKSPKPVAPPTPSFAPGPDGIPLIRRDSSIVDGRPKRAIVPPKRNSDFSGVRPKKKKYELQLKFCQEVLKEIASTKNWQLNQYFTHPVDPVALNIPTYFQVIKKPMDLGTVQQKLDSNAYEKAKDFEEDVRLIFKNCYKFNPEGDYVNAMGHQLEELFDRKWAQKDEWIAAREPPSEPSEAEEEDDEEASEEEDADSEDDRNEKIKALQAQIEAMSKQMGELTQSKKKKKSTPPASKSKKPKGKKEKAPAQFPNLNKAKDKKKSSKVKAPKERYVTFQEKQYISNGIGMLPERQMHEALKIIQTCVPQLANNSDGEIELDIEEVPNHALLKLLDFVKKYAPPPPEEQEVKSESFSTAPTKSKKNKPMSKQEQEAQIDELKSRLGAYGGPVSPDTMQSVETGNDSSDDSADSEESEEE